MLAVGGFFVKRVDVRLPLGPSDEKSAAHGIREHSPLGNLGLN